MGVQAARGDRGREGGRKELSGTMCKRLFDESRGRGSESFPLGRPNESAIAESGGRTPGARREKQRTSVQGALENKREREKRKGRFGKFLGRLNT